MNPILQHQANLTRRHFFGRTATGIGTAALASLMAKDARAADRTRTGGLPGLPHFAAKAKRVIYLFQNGAPTHVDLFDYKPELTKRKGEQIPDSVVKGARFSTMTGGQTVRPCLPEITKFKQHGKGGAWVSDFLPRTAAVADDLCFVKSMFTTQVNHAPAICFFLTGSEMPGRPSMGSWLTYGLGSETEELPGFVVMTSRDKEASCGQIFYDFYWGSGFLPTKFQGVKFRGQGDPVLYISNPDGVSKEGRRASLDDLAKLNEMTLKEFGDPEVSTRIAQYEMAYKMQTSVPELTDFSKEPQKVLDSYGPDVKRQGSFAYNCLMARRLVERGTRFVQLLHAGWDQHRNLNTQLKVQCTDTDAPSAALVSDLKRLGLLDDTLVIWGGEFGRTPTSEGGSGRDHNNHGFCVWLAGGGIKGGMAYGSTDEFGFAAVDKKVHIHDLHATILHLMGIDHEKLTYRYSGRDFRLTDVEGKVAREIIA